MADLVVGDSVPIYVLFRNAEGALADPTAVTLTITRPDATIDTPSPEHPSTGRYEHDLGLTQAGRWSWRWVGTGNVAAVEDGSVMVRGTGLLVATPGSPTANSYLTVADADTIALVQGLGEASDAWLAAGNDRKERALIRATAEVDAYIASAGTTYTLDQPLLFPRLYDAVGGVPYIIPNVRMATFWQAVHLLVNADLLDRANTRRARGMISFSDDDGSGSMVSVKPEFGMLSAQALTYLQAVGRTTGQATLRSVPIESSYG
jgi:hypothetical protein